MACNDCAVRGVWIKCYHTTVYPSSVTHLTMRHPLRAKFRQAFRNHPEIRDLADQKDPPRIISDEYVHAAMAIGEASDKDRKSKVHPAKTYGFFERSVFVKHLDYWRPWMFNLRDTDHMNVNRVRGIINALKGEGNMKMTPQRMKFELSLGRFEAYAPETHLDAKGKEITTWPEPPWKATKAEIQFIDEALPNFVRLPQVIYTVSMYTLQLSCILFTSGVYYIIMYYDLVMYSPSSVASSPGFSRIH